jgi:uncharacterized protein (TIGR03643 family)
MARQVRSQNAGQLQKSVLEDADVGGVIEMALSDHVSFETIKSVYGLTPDEVKLLMRKSLKPGSYRAWRKRVSTFGSRRARYKSALPLSANVDYNDEPE